MKLSVCVDMEIKDGRSYLSVNFPKEQQIISAQQTSHILAGAISLLIKSSSKGDKIKDYELIKEVIDHLHSEFVNVDSYSDVYVTKNMV